MEGSRLLTRREAIGAVSAAGAALAFGCGDTPTSPSSTAPSTTASTNAACAVTPTETIGPFPSLADLFRSDIREGKSGTVLTLTIRVVNAANGCAAVPNANVEIWHVDAAGDYSQYGTQTTQTFLRGIQTSNGSGEVTFTTIYPGLVSGPRNAHPCRGHDRWAVGEGDADCVSGDRSTTRSTRAASMRRAEPTRCPTCRTESFRTVCPPRS